MSNHTQCHLCTKVVSYQGIGKHYFSASHQNDLSNALFKRKSMILEWISEYEKGKKSHSSFIPIYFKSLTKCYTICYPCKYLGPDIKPHICDNRPNNFKKIKDILLNMTEEIKGGGDTHIPPPPPSPTPTPTETEDISALKKKIEVLEKKEALNKKLVDRAFDIQDILLSILTDKQNKDFDSFKECMCTMKKNYPEVFEVMYRDLGGDQGKEDEFD